MTIDVIDRIERYVGKVKFVGWQFAADGKWDAELRVFSDDLASQLNNVQTWLSGQSTDNIAFEAVFETNEHVRFFFGVRITHLNKQEKAAIFEKLITQIKKGLDLKEAMQNVRVIIKAPHIFAVLPEYLEAGIFSLWNRVKSVVIWEKNKKLGKKSEIILPEEIGDHAQIPDAGFEPFDMPQPKPFMIEAAWKKQADKIDSYQCWISLPISKQLADKYVISREKYFAAATTFLGYNPALES